MLKHIFSLLLLTFCRSQILPNILQNTNKIITSQYIENTNYNLSNLINDESNQYSSGTIIDLPHYIYLNVNSKYYTSNFRL